MPQPIIEVKNLSKQYKIGADTTYKTLTESITNTIRHPFKTIKNYNKQNEIFWALKDINFTVNRGEVVGIIGRNGAGKSTLLKVLSRITHPTGGEVTLRGRVGSLLEVGTGFHPELSGRENIYFNGAILGMKKREIDEKFDEIVRFAEIEKFLDTPVKRYSRDVRVPRVAPLEGAHTYAPAYVDWCIWTLRYCWWTRCWLWGMRLSEIRGGEGQCMKWGAGKVKRKENPICNLQDTDSHRFDAHYVFYIKRLN